MFWNPSREAFSIPGLDFCIYWYSLWFAFGFYGAVVICRFLIWRRGGKRKEIREYVDHLAAYCFFGLLIGARLGHVLFYEPSYYLDHPFEILALRQGGLSSHGAVLGLFFALWRFHKRPAAHDYLPRGKDLLDLLAVGSMWTAACIRIGNFFNQEIVGTPTALPWAIVFGAPADAVGGIARHPVQLYEAGVSLVLLCSALYLCKDGGFAKNGRVAGWILISTFTARFFLEFLKVPQCSFDAGLFHMGQLLSLPIIFTGGYLVVTSYGRK